MQSQKQIKIGENMREMYIYKYVGSSYGGGIVLLDIKIVNEHIYNLHHNSHEWDFLGKQKFSEKILRKLDSEKTLDTHGEIDLSYIE